MNFELGGFMKKSTALRKEQPEVVKRAIAEENKALLSYLGKKGAVQANDNREARRAFAERCADVRSAEDAQIRIDANEHIVPIDSDDERNVA